MILSNIIKYSILRWGLFLWYQIFRNKLYLYTFHIRKPNKISWELKHLLNLQTLMKSSW